MFSPHTLRRVFPLIYKSLPNCKLQILLISAHGKLVLRRPRSVWASARFGCGFGFGLGLDLDPFLRDDEQSPAQPNRVSVCWEEVNGNFRISPG